MKVKRIITVLALITLALAYVSGLLMREKESLTGLEKHFPDKAVDKVSELVYEVKDPASHVKEGDLIVESTQGWGGPLKTAILIDEEGNIQETIVLSHKETPAFFKSLVTGNFFDQFTAKPLADPYKIDEDVDAVTGATISSEAFTKAVRKGAHWAGINMFGMDIQETPPSWKVGTNEIILLVLYAAILVSVLMKFKKARLYILAFSMVFLGFYVSRPLTLSTIASILLGYFPSLYDQLFWWLLVFGTVLLILLLGKNIYCYWMCPFGAIQEFISLIGGFKISVNQRLMSYMRYTVYFLLWLALMITFITSNPALGTFEPFATLFSLKGLPIQWYLVSIAIISSFFIPRFWCKLFCPGGACLSYTAKIKTKIRKRFGKLKPAEG